MSETKKLEEENSQEELEFTTGAKLKILATLAIVGFAAYVAYWVQEPAGLKTDIFSSPTQSITSQTQASLTQTQEVSIIDFHFDPGPLTIKKGTTVLWTNKDAVAHTVTGDNFTSATLTPGQSFSYTFQRDGTFQYHCSFHPQMKASVAVGSESGSEGSTLQNEQMLQATPALTDVSKSSLKQKTPAVDATIVASGNTTTLNSGADLSTLRPAAQADSSNSLDANLLSESAPAKDESSLLTPDTNLFVKSAPAPLPPPDFMAKEKSSSNGSNKSIEFKTPKATRIPDSGPEDYFYVAIFLLILYLKRSVLLKKSGK